MPILYRYIVKELFSPFLAILFVFTGLLFLTKSLKLIELIANKTASIIEVIFIFSLVIPQFLEMAIPMAFLLSIIIAIGRLSADSEIVVMRSVGLSINKLLIPLAGFSLLIFVFSLTVSTWLRPVSNQELGLRLFKLATAQVSSSLISGTFNEIGPLTIYARDAKNGGSVLNNVIISDRRNPESQRVFYAQDAKFHANEETRSIKMELFDGSMEEGTGSDISKTKYSLNAITISESELTASNPELDRKKNSEMGTMELIHNIQTTGAEIKANPTDKSRFHLSRLRVELQKRFTLPASCLCVGILALALGIQPSRGGSRYGMTVSFITGIVVILLYYIAFAFSSAISETNGKYIEGIMWLPNLIFFSLGLIIFKNISSERWTNVVDTVINSIINLKTKFKKS